MSENRTGAFSLVLVPALLTLIVTVVRVVGELQGWNPTFFSKPGGGSAVVGITWLVLVFGFWFGWRLRRPGSPPPGKAALLYLTGIAVLAGGMIGLVQLGLVTLPSRESPGEPTGLAYGFALLAVAAVVAVFAWPRLTGTLMLYGVLARIPVVVVTYLDLHYDWHTHYGELPPGAVTADPFIALCTPQVTLWPFVFTPLVGGLLGCLGAAMAGRRRG